jgi:pimeloyl-ACP methyl ester carboxylesterase
MTVAEKQQHAQEARPRDVREELRQLVRDTAYRWRLASGRADLPEATPSDGPDPYGNPDPEWMEIDWREHQRTIDVVGAQTNYVEMGDGPPLVMLHGLGGSWQNWLENIPHFARDHRVLALDLPGFGGSPMPPWEVTIPAYGRYFRDFLERTGIERCSLVSNSMGGFIATELAINEPERVDDLTLVSAAGITWARARNEPAEMAARMLRAAAPLALRFQMSAIRRPKMRQRVFNGLWYKPNALRRELIWEQVVPALQSPATFDSMRKLVGYDIRSRLEEIEVPTLIVWGRQDAVVPVPAAEIYKKLIGDNAELVIFDRCGHMPELERPVRFNRVVGEFLKRAGELD